MRSVYRFSFFPLALGMAAALTCAPLTARAADTEQTLVDKAALTVQDIFAGATPQSNVAINLGKARAVMVCPSIFQMSIAFGGAGGGCLLLARDARGSWSDPAFYTLSTASVGIQFGVQNSQAIFFVMTDRGLQALLDSQFQFGANAGASFATMSSNVERGTAGVSNTDILVAQKSQGVFAGAALGGTKLTVNSDANRAYYKQAVGPEDIVVSMRVNNPGADPLRSVLMRYGKMAPATTKGGKAGSASQRNGGSTTGADSLPSDNVSTPGAGRLGSVQHENLAPIAPRHR